MHEWRPAKAPFARLSKKLARSWSRIIKKGSSVDLPVWQRPIAILITLGFFLIALVGEIVSSLTRSFEPLPEPLVQPVRVEMVQTA